MADFEITFESVRAVEMITRIADKSRWLRTLKSLMVLYGFKDVIKHFRDEQGSDGKWPALSSAYSRWKKGDVIRRAKAQGKKRPTGSSKLLVLTGHLRQNFLPSNIRENDKTSVALFNPVKYAHRHDKGTEGMPKREFMWLSKNATSLLERGFISSVLSGRA